MRKILSFLILIIFLPQLIIGQFNCQPLTLDETGSVGEWSNLLVVNGKPAISYLDKTNIQLMYIRAIDESGHAWNAPQVVDQGGVGFYNSMKIVNGHPAISYKDNHNGDLKYVRALDPDGLIWGTPVTVDATDQTGHFTSLEVVDGHPAISYYDNSEEDLNYVRALDPNGNSWGTPIIVDAFQNVGQFNSLKVINGHPAISYGKSLPNSRLKFIRALDSQGTSWGSSIELDGHITPVWNNYTSLQEINGIPVVAYSDILGDDNIKYIRALDPNGSSWGTPIILDNHGTHVSLNTINNQPAVSYYKNQLKQLWIVQALDSNGDNWEAPILVDDEGDVGVNNSLQVVNGQPAMSYFEAGPKWDLKYTRLPDQEVCDGIDNNCDGQIDEGFDLDSDNYTTCQGDCDDNNPLINPGLPEICDDGLDNNCDGLVDYLTNRSIQDLLDIFNNGDIQPNSNGNGNGLLNAFENHIDEPNIGHLQWALIRSDGSPSPKDFIIGSDVPLLNSWIQEVINNLNCSDGDLSTFSVPTDIIDGVEEHQEFSIQENGDPDGKPNRGLILYPNPATNILHLDLQGYLNQKISISIYNHLGQEVFFFEKNELQDALVSFDLSKFSNGIYLVFLKTPEVNHAKQFVISR